MLTIDVFTHFMPHRFLEAFQATAPDQGMFRRSMQVKPLCELDARLRLMDAFDDYTQVLSLGSPPIEAFAGPDTSPELARIGNDGLAELVAGHPGRFPGFLAALPLNNPDAALAEAERATSGAGCRRLPDLFERGRPPAGRPDVHADLRVDPRGRRADLPAPGAQRALQRLRQRAEVEVRDLVGAGVAVRNQHRDGTSGVFGRLRPVAEPEGGGAPSGRHHSVRRRTRRARLGPVGQAHVGRGLLRAARSR